MLEELFELYDDVCEVKEGSEKDWKDGKPSKDDEPPPPLLLKEEEDVYDVVVWLLELPLLPELCNQLFESMVVSYTR